MDGFSTEYKGHIVFAEVSGPEMGPWVGNFSVFAINDRSERYCVLQGKATGAFSSIELTTAGATAQARQCIDQLLVQQEHNAAEVLRQRIVAHYKNLWNT